jgi:hypothetical protein
MASPCGSSSASSRQVALRTDGIAGPTSHRGRRSEPRHIENVRTDQGRSRKHAHQAIRVTGGDYRWPKGGKVFLFGRDCEARHGRDVRDLPTFLGNPLRSRFRGRFGHGLP